ncbi:hypothetical protein HJD18_05995 [Thermoleophilia bacterium SCSIO 60948]|nr:hypothetical protein HJD18_05995 [Thermoleophilia bacterium SCSIO 60948]
MNELSVAPQVVELLSDEQIESVRTQAASGGAPCLHCGADIDGDAALVLVVDSARRRVAARLSHPGCGPSDVIEGEIADPSDARIAARWASFTMPGVPLLVLEPSGGVWTDEERPAILRMLERLGFGPARDALDSELFATGTGPPPRSDRLTLTRRGPDRADLALILDSDEELELLPGAAHGDWIALGEDRRGALVLAAEGLGIDAGRPLALETLLPDLIERGLAAWVELA